jgi:LysR family glycine cleavage system transcriptional activator
VRAFEAAARHLSFTRAANELGVTAAAVSQQIKILETHLGVTLFRRLNKGLVLTEPAQRCLGELCQALNNLADIFGRLSGTPAGNMLTVRTSPSFASQWLVPRLHRFQRACPAHDVRLLTSTQIACLDSPEIDVAITYTVPPDPKSRATQLMLEEVYPVCSPQLIVRGKPLSRPEHLQDYPLIHDDTLQNEVTFPTWQMWLSKTRAAKVDASRGLRFSLSSMAIQAALNGHGVLLGRSALVGGDLAARRLIKPFAIRYPARFAYCIETRDGPAARPAVADFVAWLHAEAASTPGNVLKQRARLAG